MLTSRDLTSGKLMMSVYDILRFALAVLLLLYALVLVLWHTVMGTLAYVSCDLGACGTMWIAGLWQSLARLQPR